MSELDRHDKNIKVEEMLLDFWRTTEMKISTTENRTEAKRGRIIEEKKQLLKKLYEQRADILRRTDCKNKSRDQVEGSEKESLPNREEGNLGGGVCGKAKF